MQSGLAEWILLAGEFFAATQRPTKVALNWGFKMLFDAENRHFVVMYFEGNNHAQCS